MISRCPLQAPLSCESTEKCTNLKVRWSSRLKTRDLLLLVLPSEHPSPFSCSRCALFVYQPVLILKKSDQRVIVIPTREKKAIFPKMPGGCSLWLYPGFFARSPHEPSDQPLQRLSGTKDGLSGCLCFSNKSSTISPQNSEDEVTCVSHFQAISVKPVSRYCCSNYEPIYCTV